MTELGTTIRARGYWQVQLRPSVFAEKRVGSLAELERAIRRAHVVLRGWDYPHVPENVERHNDHIQGIVSWDTHHEIWRLYQSCQFVHLFSMSEDYMESRSRSIRPGEVLELTSTLWTITEMFLFCARLVEALTVGPEVTISYKLVGLQNRRLQTLDPMRAPLGDYRKASPDLREFDADLTLPSSKLIASAPELAVDQALALYERFKWEPDRQSVIEEQRRLLERRF